MPPLFFMVLADDRGDGGSEKREHSEAEKYSLLAVAQTINLPLQLFLRYHKLGILNHILL